MSDRDGLAFESAARQRGRPAAQRSGQRPDQPLLQHPHAANAPLVEEFPVGGEVRRFRVSRRTAPPPVALPAVAVGALLRQLFQFLFLFTLLPASRTLVHDEIVRRMHDRQAPPVGRLVLERDGRRLVVVLQHVRIVFHLIDEREFNPMAFKLDGDAHLATGIAAAHILAAAAHSPGGIGRTDFRDGRLRLFGQAHAAAPEEKILVAQHRSIPLQIVFQAGRLLRALTPTRILQRRGIPSAGLHQQILDTPAVVDGALQLGSELIRHVDRKTPVALSAI